MPTEIKVDANTGELVTKLRANRTIHIEQFEEAHAAWVENMGEHYVRVEEVIQANARLLTELTPSSKFKEVGIPVPPTRPKSYAEAYDQAIEMLEVHTGETITLDSATFRIFVMDKWDWKSGFEASYFSNTGKMA
jgi:hypothetical protein